MKTKYYFTFILLLLICSTTAFGQEASQEVAESCGRHVFGGVWTLAEAKSIARSLFVTFILSGVLSIPLIATWDSENIATIARILFWIPAVVAIVSLIGIIVMWFGIMFSTTATAAM